MDMDVIMNPSVPWFPALPQNTLLLLCSNAFGNPVSSNNTLITPSPIPLSFVGNVAAIQAPAGAADTRIYYQEPDNSIHVLLISGPFTTGRWFGSELVVPAAEVQFNTLIAAVTIDGGDFTLAYLFFISPSNVLSGYIGTPAAGWVGGPACTDCITALNFVVQPGNRVLYAMGNDDPGSPAVLRVGFISAGAPDTLTEIDYDPTNGWRIAVLS
ncbi:hypothetical protein B0H17DRAFT_1149855 [Mycena rosella]|uniref:Uncharacterized protein n=1 Tax=Mycena rosella TaxID=1033263 RepID=A0AAD7BY40_MYCRO|nr:hypothetical protein B0H17DRAFT_1149855 [Mycena rosella]